MVQMKSLVELAEPTIKLLKELLPVDSIVLILDESGNILNGKSNPQYKLLEDNPVFIAAKASPSQTNIIFDSEGEAIGYITILNTDNTSEKHSHLLKLCAAAIEKEYTTQYNQILDNELRATLESIPVGVFIVTNKMHISRSNAAIQKLIGVKCELMVGKHIDSYLNTDGFFNKLFINKTPIFDRKMMFTTFKGKITCDVSVSFIDGPGPQYQGMVVKLKSTKYMYRFLDTSNDASADYKFENIIGKSKEIKKSIRISQVAAKSNSSVLLVGATGTGKELFAQAIHNASERKTNPFIAINCGSFPRGLIESELFGYEGGAFTGAKKDGQPGKFELAEGGTLFLDEIGDMPIDLQVTLLRVLQNKEIVRVGGSRMVRVDVRIISATNKNLEQSIIDNTFRSDLYYRLNVFSINIPPLRDRKEDLMLLSNFFIDKYAHYLDRKPKSLDNDVKEAFMHHSWPGNIRELENVIERAMNLSETNAITMEDLPEYMINHLQNSLCFAGETKESTVAEPGRIEQAEKQIIIDALLQCKGNLAAASEEIGISRRALYRRLEKHNIYAELYRKTT